MQAVFKRGLGVCAVMLAGCGSTPMTIKAPDPAIERLTAVAETIQQHHNDLSDIESARFIETTGKRPTSFDPRYMPSMTKVVSLGAPWHGPIGPLITKLSLIAGLEKPLEIGVRPPGDVIVHVETDYRQIIDILHDAGSQAGSRADVTLKAKDRRVEIEYFPY